MSFAHRGLRPRRILAECLIFDGTDDYVEVANHSDFNAIEYNVPWTISAWFRIDADINSSPGPAIIAKASASGTQRGWVIMVTTAGNIRVELAHDWGAGNRVAGNSAAFGGLDDSSWHHLVVTYDGGGSRSGLTAWVDSSSSSFAGSADSITGSMLTSRAIEIGQRDGTQNWPGDDGGVVPDGYLDEVAIWGGIEMSSSQVAELYNGGAVVDYTTLSTAGSLVEYWRMGEGATYPTIPGEVAGHDGTMTNMTSDDLVVRP